MRYSAATLTVAVTAAFVGGLVVSSLTRYGVSDARADGIANAHDLGSMKHGDIPTTPNPEMNSRLLVDTSNATIAVQSGNVAKHIHPKTDEIQYIIEGSGSMWLGTERKEFKPGTLIVIPKGTPHAGTIVTSGPVKAIAIKIPPQPRDDVVLVN